MKRIVVLICLLLGYSPLLYSQLLQWNTFGNTGTELTEPSVFNNTNITTADLTFGAGIVPAGNGLRFGGNSWFDTGNTAGGSTITEAIAGNNYLQFVVTPNFNYAFTPTSFVFSWGRSGTGPINVALRSSVDGFVSNLGLVTGLTSLSNGNTITITGLTNISTATTFRIYGYGGTGTGGTAGFDQSAPAPGIVNVQLNGTTQALGPISITSGDWNVASTWSTNAVPTATDNVIISLGHTVYTNTALTRTGTTKVYGAFELRNGGFASGTDFTYMNTTAALNFNTSAVYGVVNNHVYWPVANGPNNVAVLAGGISLTSANRTVGGTFSTAAGVSLTTSTLTLNGICRIDAGGFFNTAPLYGASSTLVYNSSGVYGRGFEWSALGVGTIGTTAGYPNVVQISNNTTLNYINGAVAGAVGIKAIATHLTIDTGSALHMNFGAVSAGGPMVIGGNLINAGTLTLGEANGDDLKLSGNFSNTGTFNGNNRAVFFTKTGTQTIFSSSALTIPYVVFQPSVGNTLVQLLSSLTVSAPLGGNAISFSATLDSFDINGNSLIIGTPGLTNTIFGTGTFRGSTTSNLTLLGTGSIGALKFNTTTPFSNLATLTINRTSGNIAAVMGSTLTINSALVLSNGILDVGNNILALGTVANISGASATNFIIADSSAPTPLASVRKFIPAAGTYAFPIGDNAASADGIQYAPVSITLTGGTYSGLGYVAFSVNDVKDPALDATTDYITRYWEMKRPLTLSPVSYQINSTYYPTDVVGNELLCLSNQWSGSLSLWYNNGVTSPANTLTINCTQLVASTRVTKGYRDPEINVTQGATNYLTASTYSFANTGLGNFTDVVFTVQNLGQQNLNLLAATLTGASEFTVLSVYSSPVLGPTGTTTFTIRFYPLTAGTFTASISIPNNDASGAENPYVINFSGTGFCAAETLTATPISGPVGTEVTLTNSAAFSSASSAAVNGLATTLSTVSPTQVKITVPNAAASGTIVLTNALGCTASTPFTVIDLNSSSCQGSLLALELFLSEVTDATFGGLTYIEIYNGTGATVNLANYSLKTASNGGAYSSTLALTNFNLANGSTFVVSIGSDGSCTSPGGDGSLANQTGSISGGINFDVNGNDHIGLFNNANLIDSFGVFESNNWADALGLGDRGATFRRNSSGMLPSPSFNTTNWTILNWAGTGLASCSTNDYTNIGLYSFSSTNLPPVITTQPIYIPTCKSASISVTANEGYNGTGDLQELAYQWYAVAPNTTTWTALTNTGIYAGTTSATILISDVSGIDGYQFYCQVRENSATCYTASNAVKVTATAAVTWNGSSWTPTSPTISTAAILAGNYNTTTHGNIDACSLTINSGVTATLTTNSYINIQNDLTVQANANLQIQDSGSLVMIENAGLVSNNGTIQVSRNTSPFDKYDYTYWSSPVTAANLGTTFPNWRSDYSFSFNTANFSDTQTINNLGVVTANVPDGFDDAAPFAWTFAGTAATLAPGKGYAIMMPTTQASYPSAPISVSFTGTVNTGTILTPLSLSANAVDATDDYNLIGNPYPSSIDANAFIDANLNTSGSLYFWTHVGAISVSNPGPDAQNFISDDYAVYNKTGGTRTSYTGSALPNGKIGTGQAFMVESITATNVQFTNSMRNKTYSNSQFFRPATTAEIAEQNSQNRYWLNLKNSDGMFSQQLIGYIDQATYAADFAYDALVAQTKNYLSFYSTIGESNYRIQARPTFTETDEVPLGYFAAVSGQFTIEVDDAEGLFSQQNQPIYLEDRELNILHDLSQSPYSFTTNSGRYAQRFAIRYMPNLAVNPFDTAAKTVQIFKRNNQLEVVSTQEEIERVEIYDLLGRKCFEKVGINATQFNVQEPINLSVVLVRVYLKSGLSCTKKIGF
ncbi:MAG: choice-of-anchor D domain-containing protein [Flavobacterium psychrophilum]